MPSFVVINIAVLTINGSYFQAYTIVSLLYRTNRQKQTIYDFFEITAYQEHSVQNQHYLQKNGAMPI